MKMNRKGNFPLMLLFFVALMLVSLALFSFASFGSKVGDSSKEFIYVINELELKETYILSDSKLISYETVNCVGCVETDLKKKFQEVNKIIDDNFGYSLPEGRYVGVGNFFGKIRSGDFEFRKDGVDYILEIERIFVKASRGENLIIRDFNLKMWFDSSGNFIREEIVYLY